MDLHKPTMQWKDKTICTYPRTCPLGTTSFEEAYIYQVTSDRCLQRRLAMIYATWSIFRGRSGTRALCR